MHRRRALVPVAVAAMLLLLSGCASAGGEEVEAVTPATTDVVPDDASESAEEPADENRAGEADEYWTSERVAALEAGKETFERPAPPQPVDTREDDQASRDLEPPPPPTTDVEVPPVVEVVEPPQDRSADACAGAREAQQVVTRVIRDWEGNLAVQGDVARRLEAPADDMAELASAVGGDMGRALQAYSDAIAALRVNFIGSGDVLQSDSDHPNSYNMLTKTVLAGVDGC